jgi:hypothetical protein
MLFDHLVGADDVDLFNFRARAHARAYRGSISAA